MAKVSLKVNGSEFSGWRRVRVMRGMETISGSFELTVSGRFKGQPTPWPIGEEDECTVLIDGKPVITGYVDKRHATFAASEHTVTYSGRDKAGALVDCSALLKAWEFASVSLLTLVTTVAKQFKITVTMDPGLQPGKITAAAGKKAGSPSAGSTGQRTGLAVPKPPKKFSISPGESAFEVIDRACRMAGVLPMSDGQGGLLLTRAGTATAFDTLSEGKNILSGSAEYDASARYRRYIVSAQTQGSDQGYGELAAAVKGEAQDLSVRRSERVLYVRPEASATAETAKTRAAWEAKIRAARGDTITITVKGWTQSNGVLWPINALVTVTSDKLGVNGQMLIVQAVHTIDDGGELTELTLRRPDAFIPEPTINQASGLWKELAGGAR